MKVPKFKAGDIIARIRFEHMSMEEGDIAMVTGSKWDIVTLKEYKGNHDARNLRLATEEEKTYYMRKIF